MDKKIYRPNQPSSFNFPKKTFGQTKTVQRSFQPQWFKSWTWLHYDELRDLCFCYICIQAHAEKKISSGYIDQCFISRGFSNWKDATSVFKKHDQSKCHREALERTVTLPKSTKDIGETLSERHANEKSENRRCLLKIISNIRFLARQGLPLRGDGNENDSNFIQLMKIRGEDDTKLLEWMKKKTNKYTSADMQNEILKVMAFKVLREVAENIRNSGFFSVMADETTDKSNREQVVIVIRHVDAELVAHEEFIGLNMVDSIDAATLTEVIKDCLLRMNFSLNNCRGQCYDGASNMSGAKSGVAKRISDEERRAVYTHCYGHALNLAASDAVKQSKIMRDALDTTFEISKLVKFSPKRDSRFEKLKQELAPDTPGLRVLCPTRWTVRAESLQSVLDNYAVLQDLFDECKDSVKDTEIKSRIIGVVSQMTQFDFFFGVMLGQLLLRHTDNLSKALQQVDLSAAEGQALASMTVTTLQKLRNQDSFDLFWNKLNDSASKADVNEPSLPRRRKAPKRFQIGHGEPEFPTSVADLYRQHYYEALDLIINCIKDRFDQPGYKVYKNLENLLLLSITSDFESYEEEFNFIVDFYGSDIDSNTLKVQLDTLSTSYGQVMGDTKNVRLSDVLEFFRQLSKPMRGMFSEVVTLIKLLLVMPATNASSERTFSALRRIKTYLRTTMTQTRLNCVMVLHVHKDRTDLLELVSVANNFISENERRLCIFGRFSK